MRLTWWTTTACAAVLSQALSTGPARLRDMARQQNLGVEARASQQSLLGAQPLQCLEVTSPVLTDRGAETAFSPTLDATSRGATHCQLTLMDYHFANSYGQPFVAQYKPPACNFTRVVMNFTVASKGRQFDRLAVMYLGDNEVWRTSTAEPKPDPGIVWTYLKDMTTYLSLWKQPQTLIFDLGNIVNDQYTGLFNATLTATFINEVLPDYPGAAPADQIIPITARKSKQNMASAFTYPADKPSVAVTLPRNINRAVVSISATGQADEEFWWSNVPENATHVFEKSSGVLPGLGSFREVRLRIDGRLAGLSWPFPVIFTGGVSPPLHRPIVGQHAFDLLEDEIDVTPWLAILCDGNEHTFTLEVVGADDAVVANYWLITAKIFVWLSKDGSITKGNFPIVSVNPSPSYRADISYEPENWLDYSQRSQRSLLIGAEIVVEGKSTRRLWKQRFAMINNGLLNDKGNYQAVTTVYIGENRAMSDSYTYFDNGFAYGINLAYHSKSPDGNYSLTIDANLTQSVDITVSGLTAFSNGLEPFLQKLPQKAGGSIISTVREGGAFFYQSKAGSGGNGHTKQNYLFGARPLLHEQGLDFLMNPVLYERDISVVNEKITSDSQYTYRSNIPSQLFQTHASPPGKVAIGGYAPLPAKEHGGTNIFLGKDLKCSQKQACPKQTGETISQGNTNGAATNVTTDSAELLNKAFEIISTVLGPSLASTNQDMNPAKPIQRARTLVRN